MKKSYPCFFSSNFILTCLILCCSFSLFGNGAPSVFEHLSNASVACETAPPIQCLSTYYGCPGSSTDPSNTGFATAQPGDADCPNPVMTYTDIEMTVGPCNGEKFIKRVWTASYPNNADPWLVSDCTQKIVIEDSQSPTIACPNDIVLATNCHSVSWPEAGAGDNCGIASLTANIPSGSSFGVGTTAVTYTALDNCGNAVSCSFNVTIQGDCCGAPQITCPADYVGCIAAPVVKSETGYATSDGTDACGDALVTFSDVTVTEGPCKGEFVLSRTWTATSQNTGQTSSCVQSITAKDDTPPTIANCPTDMVINTGASCVATWSLPVANDDCGMENFSASHTSGSVFGDGTTTVTYTAVDQCGNTSTCSFNVTCDLGCQTAPSIACPADFFGCVSSTTDPATTGQATTTAASGHCQNATITYTDTQVSSGPCAGQVHIQRTWTATEQASGLATTCIQNIYLTDSTGPALTACPANIVLPDNTYIGTWVAPTATDNCGTVNLTTSHNPGDVFPTGTTTVIYTATDNCGNAVSCSFTVTVVETCTTAPSISCPQDYIGCVGTSTDPSVTGIATGASTGAHCTTPTITYEDQITNGNCGAVTIVRKWIATGSGTGMTSTCFQNITLEDNVAPTIANCPANIVLAPNAACTPTWTAPTATDNCGSVTLTSNYSSGNTLPMGTTTVTYTATDACGNAANCAFTVTCSQACNTAPTITCPANFTTCPGEAYDPAAAGQATAVAGSNLCSVPTVTYSDTSVPRQCAGALTITRTWVATDPTSGLTASCDQTIILTYSSKAIIENCPADIIIPVGGSSTPTWVVPTASHGCGIKSFTSTHNPGDVFSCGTTTVTYTVVDNCDRITTCSFTVTVNCQAVCSVAPIISCPANYSACPGSSIDPSVSGSATATNSGAGCTTPSISYADVVLQTFACTGGQQIERTWTATSGSFSASCTQTLTLNETAAPTLTNCPADITTGNSVVTWTAPTISSGCGGYTLTASHNSGDAFPCGPTTVTYSTQDACGNVVSCSFVVNVVCNDGSDSGFSDCPTDIVVSCNSNSNISWNIPEFASSCSSSCDTDTIAGYLFMGSFGGSKYFCSISPSTWPDANAAAQALGGNLAVVTTAEENAYLANILTIQSAFIGCSDGVVEGDFIWTDGTPVNYTNWYPGQPNNYQNYQDYCEMLSNGQWNDQYNHVKLEYIVELSCNSVVQTLGPPPGSTFSPGSTTIEYTATDGCGNSEVCSFDVIVSGGLSLECIADQAVECPSNAGVQATWQAPQATTCCGNCNSSNPGPIAGFIYMGSLGTSHYYCSNDPALWTDAQANAIANGGHLAVINDATENAYLANLLTIQSAYIGLSDSGTEGTFQWVDGSGLSYNNWYPGQPNDYQAYQDYVELLASGEWNDQYNNKPLEYIMEIPAGCMNVVQTAGPASGSVLSPGTHTVSYQATDGCGNVANCSFDIVVTKTGGNSGYCSSSAAESKSNWIEKVKFGAISNQSGNNGGYAAFSGCHNFNMGSYYQLALTPGALTSGNTVYWSCYIDYNHDGDFNDAGEYVATGSGAQTLSGTIVIPTNCVLGQTKMRVIMKKGSVAANACANFGYGEVEDYCINILPSSNNLVSSDQVGNSAQLTKTKLVTDSAVEYRDDQTLDFGDIEIYPNPATDVIYIKSASIEAATIFDAQGRVVINKQFSNNIDTKQIEVTELNSGLYTIQLKTDTGKVTAKKIAIHQP